MTATADKTRPAVCLEHRPWTLSVVWLAGLGAMFALSYGFSNWVTSLRGHVPSIVFGWEHRIPFLAWTIVPYWSTDFLYALALFMCRTRGELNVHAKRLAIAQLISVSGFLLFPLRFSFDRPHPAGLFGWMFDALAGFDMPFNQAPSLHIALLLILWELYTPKLPPRWRWLLHAWFALIGVSVPNLSDRPGVDFTGAAPDVGARAVSTNGRFQWNQQGPPCSKSSAGTRTSRKHLPRLAIRRSRPPGSPQTLAFGFWSNR